jgi:N6-L-threonylcarbamoyladenine synthase
VNRQEREDAKAFADIVADRCTRAVERFKSEIDGKTLVVSGGVAANGAVRDSLQKLCAAHGLNFVAPPRALCGDNGAMIAWAGIERLQRGLTDSLDVPAKPRWALDSLKR